MNSLDVQPEWLAAISTILLAVFAAVQILLEIVRRRAAAAAARIALMGPAWLARRTLQQPLKQAAKSKNVFEWAKKVGQREGLDRLEGQLLEVIRLGGEATGKEAVAAEAAFENFLAYADRVNELTVFAYTGDDGGGGRYPTEEEKARYAETIASPALQYAHAAVSELEKLVPRRKHEEPLPVLDHLPFHGPGLPSTGT